MTEAVRVHKEKKKRVPRLRRSIPASLRDMEAGVPETQMADDGVEYPEFFTEAGIIHTIELTNFMNHAYVPIFRATLHNTWSRIAFFLI